MTQRNETPVLLLSLLVTASVLGGGGWWLSQNLRGSNPGERTISSGSGRLSAGESVLLPSESNQADFNQLKQAGVNAIATQQSAQAVTFFEAALQRYRNAPETLVYLNNARIGNQKAYEIAVPLPIKTDTNSAAEILRGIAQAQTEINRSGGVNGVPIKVLIADDENSPETARQIAANLLKREEVLGVIGHFASDVTIAAGKVYNEGGLVTISPISTSVKLSGFGKYVMRSVPSDYVAARALADYGLKTLKQKTFAVFFNSQSGYSRSLKEEFVTAISLGGGQVSTEFDLASGNFDAGASVEQALKQNAKVLMLAPNAGETGGTLDQALQVIQANQKRAMVLAGDDAYAPKILEKGREQALGTVVAVPWHIEANENLPFVRESRKLWGADVNWRSATAYDAMQALTAAMRQEPTRLGIQQALAKTDFSAPGASQPVRFLPSGDRSIGIQLVKIVEGSRSRTGFDFTPITP